MGGPGGTSSGVGRASLVPKRGNGLPRNRRIDYPLQTVQVDGVGREGGMSGSAAKVVITERQQEVLRKLSTGTTVAKRLTQRSAIILLAFEGLDNEAIGERVGLERHQVGIWRRRWQKAFAKLIQKDGLESNAVLRHAME